MSTNAFQLGLPQLQGASSNPGYGIGELVAFNANTDINITINGMELLKTGYYKPYTTNYTNAITISPGLRVYPTSTVAAEYATTVAGVGMLGVNYIGISSTHQYYTPNILTTVPTQADTKTALANSITNVAFNNTAVVFGSAVNVAPYYSLTGTGAYTLVGGVWTTWPGGVFATGNNIWCSLYDFTNNAHGSAYLAAANPSGAWTIGAGPGFAGATAGGVVQIAFSPTLNLFVAVGTASGTATSARIATSPDGHTWTDRTAASGLSFSAVGSQSAYWVIWTGNAFIAAFQDIVGICRSLDGINWTQIVNGASVGLASGSPNQIATDGNLNIVMVVSTTQFIQSSDGGLTWQPYTVQAAYSSISPMYYVNGHWIINAIDITATLPFNISPTFIGVPTDAFAPPRWVRIG
jgi:hypothetical protein